MSETHLEGMDIFREGETNEINVEITKLVQRKEGIEKNLIEKGVGVTLSGDFHG